MPEEIKITPNIINPSLILVSELPKTSILRADLQEVQVRKFLLEFELQIPNQTHFSSKDIDQIICNIPADRENDLLDYIRAKVILSQFEQAEIWVKACLESPKIRIKNELYLVQAEVNYHQGYFKEAEFYLIKSEGISEGHRMLPIQQELSDGIGVALQLFANGTLLPAREKVARLLSLENPPFLPMLKEVLNLSYIDFVQKDYLSSCQTLDLFNSYFQIVPREDQNMKLLGNCLSLFVVASRVGTFLQNNLDDYQDVAPLFIPLHAFYEIGATSKDLRNPSELIRNPILKVIKEHASDFIDACNSMGVSLFQVAIDNGDKRFFQLARDIFQVQTQLSKILYPSIESAQEARIHVLTSLNSSDIALAREDFGGSLRALIAGVKAINHTDATFPVSLAAASSLRLGVMDHAIAVHLGDCIRYLEHSSGRREQFPEYLQERHPEYIGVWRDHLDGVRPLTEDDVININLKASALHSESAYSYQQFSKFPTEVKHAILHQSNWRHQDFIDNLLALSTGKAPIYHSFIPLALELAS